MAPRNTTVREGTRAKLTCQADGFPSNITYKWLHDDTDVQQVAALRTRTSIHADGSFVIGKVTKEDSGWYRCLPTNGIGPGPEARAYLNVTCKYAEVGLRTQFGILIHCENNAQYTFTPKTMHNTHSLRKQCTIHIHCENNAQYTFTAKHCTIHSHCENNAQYTFTAKTMHNP